jgi:hypothetical protein
MATFRMRLIFLAIGGFSIVACGWRGPATIHLLDGSSIDCPNVYVTSRYASCVGVEGGEQLYPLASVRSVDSPDS